MIKNLCEKYFFIIISIFVALGLYEWEISKSLLGLIKPMLGIVIFTMALTLKFSDFEIAIKQPKALFFGVCSQYLFMPFIAFLIAKFFNLPSELAIGLILVGSSPGGTVSNVMVYIAKADLALSISMTFISTALAPLLLPLMMWLYASQWVEIDAKALFLSTIQIVLLPLLIGLSIKTLVKDRFTKLINSSASIISILFVSLIVHAMVAANISKLYQIENPVKTLGIVFIAIVLHNLFGYICGFITAKYFAKLGNKQAKAIAIEVGVQNSGLASVLAISYFNPLSVIPSIISASWHSISGSALANFWSSEKDS